MAQQHRLGKTATTVATHDGFTRVTYHSTVVVTFNDAQFSLNSGGWHTATTKTRMNQASHQFGLGYTVFQRDGHWFVNYRGQDTPFTDNAWFVR